MTPRATMDARLAIHAIKTSLAEVGYPDANVYWAEHNSDLVVEVVRPRTPVDARLAYTAVYQAYRLLSASINLDYPDFAEWYKWITTSGDNNPWWRIDFFMPEG